MAAEDSKVPPLTQYCYQFESSLHLPIEDVALRECANCSAEDLKQLELQYDNWQAHEYLRRTDVEIWQPRCLELLGTNGTDAISVYASATRELPKTWRKEYFALLKERQTAVTRASDRVSKYRVAQESDQRKAKLTQDLPPGKRRSGQNPLIAIANPAFRKVVADTRKLSWTPSVGTTAAYFNNPPRPSGYRPIIKPGSSAQDDARLSVKAASTSSSSNSRGSTTGNLFIPKQPRP